MNNRPLSMIRCPFIWFAVNLFCVISVVSAAIEPDFLMDTDPEFREPDRLKKFARDYQSVWIAALQRPETDLQRMAAETIARAQVHGIPNLIEAVPELEKILLASSSHPAARFAAARALIVLESRDSSEKLLNVSQEFGANLRQLVEPALAQWDYAPARALWIKRLETHETHHRDLLLAIRGLGQVRETSALPTLLKIALDLVRGADVRLAAATAAGQIAETGLEQDAIRLSHETRTPQFINRLCSIHFIARHRSAAANQLLIEIASDAEPVVAAAALNRLNELDSALVLPFAEAAMKHLDPHVREQGAVAYLKLPTVERIIPVGRLLNDPHPDLRRRASEGLSRLTEKSELNEPILAIATETLNGDQWQGQEQAALLLGALNYKPVATRLVELLESSRAEVMVASAWALRRVSVRETIPAIVDKIRRQTEQRLKSVLPGLDDQVAHLFEACGVMKATEATPLVIQYIPKARIMGERSRSAAIWAIGRALEGVPNKQLGEAMIGRITDVDSPNPENHLVKLMCVITLVRTKSVEQAPALREFIGLRPPATRLGLAMRWAIKELTGEELPEPIPQNVDQGSWFIEPLR